MTALVVAESAIALFGEDDAIRLHGIILQAGRDKKVAEATFYLALWRLWQLAPWDEEEFDLGEMGVDSWDDYRTWLAGQVHESKNTLDNMVHRVEKMALAGWANETVLRCLIVCPTAIDDLLDDEGRTRKPIDMPSEQLAEELTVLSPSEARQRVWHEMKAPQWFFALEELEETYATLVAKRVMGTETKYYKVGVDYDDPEVWDVVAERLRVEEK